MRTLATLAAVLLSTVTTAAQQHFDAAGFTPLFDGASLDGWVTTGGRYDGQAQWTVEDGIIVGREGSGGTGGLLYTEQVYANFIFVCDVRMTYPFDSGVFVRMVPRGGGKGAQVTLDVRPKGEVGAVYSDGFLQHNEMAKKAFRRGEWNRVEVWCAGRDVRLRAWLNGELITDYALPPGNDGYAPRGLIGLQVHGGGASEAEDPRVEFRNVAMRRLPEFDPELFACDADGRLEATEAGRALGWDAVLDGPELDAWETSGDVRVVASDDGSVGLAGRNGDLRTKEDYRDFALRLDFRTAEMANSGIFLRADRADSHAAESGCEVQILDDFNWEARTGSALQPWQFTGSLYHSVPPGARALLPIGAWNTFEIEYAGSRLRVVLNGQELYDVDTLQVPTHGWPPFAERATRGFIGLQSHAHVGAPEEPKVWFRNVFVRRLDAAEAGVEER
ncbi:MAG: DUF1080 domain-containing protein [Planctomycetota bacterium]